MMPRSSDASMPYPELVCGDTDRLYRLYDTLRMPWLPTNGMTDKSARRLFTPFHPAFRYVARHELAHVKWSPEEMPELDFDARAYQAVEDARINMGLRRIGVPLDLPEHDRRYVATLVEADLGRGDAGAVVLRAVAGLGSNAEADVARVARGSDPELARTVTRLTERVRQRLNAGRARSGAAVASPELAVRVARDLAKELEDLEIAPHGEPGRSIIGCVFGACAHGDPEDGIPTGLLPEGDFDDDFGDEPGGDGAPLAGHLTISEPPLGARAAGARVRGARTWKRAVEGCVLRYPHRALSDGAVFRRAVRGRGGAVLVDTSGSMRFDREDLSRLVEATRGAGVVAIYGGDGDRGELRVVARDGRRAADSSLAPPGVGNVVDIPCLEWLGQQRGPRWWISDGRVTSVGDRGSASLRRHAEELCRRHRIQRVRTVDEAEKRLRTGS